MIAMDLSLSTTGWALDGEHSGLIKAPTFKELTNPRTQLQRAAWWRRQLSELIMPHGGSQVWYEGPFIHPKHIKGALPLMRLYGILDAVLMEHGCAPHPIQPSDLKKWATGKGNSPKDRMILEACNRTGRSITDDNEADAVLLALMMEEQS